MRAIGPHWLGRLVGPHSLVNPIVDETHDDSGPGDGSYRDHHEMKALWNEILGCHRNNRDRHGKCANHLRQPRSLGPGSASSPMHPLQSHLRMPNQGGKIGRHSCRQYPSSNSKLYWHRLFHVISPNAQGEPCGPLARIGSGDWFGSFGPEGKSGSFLSFATTSATVISMPEHP